MNEAERIAAGLTKAQRVKLIADHHGAWSEREQRGFPAELFGATWCGFAHLSPLGLSVRRILSETPHAE